ncbi:uncharacterized protein LOC103720790 isoform X2 [Phoenix dactylifera]|uniref:Uncharacterized protein LOC103720790 isoform X2 n=1 Tax=Phoenix dactylifera TaxID=42345 RepID=A0A8B8ZEF1_PHODC|nr:uncharacterized protein LOC103720790 isoform X2 [Phoenix dactylifera]
MNSSKMSSRHKRSKSDSERRAREDKLDSSPKAFQKVKQEKGNGKGDFNMKKKPLPDAEIQHSLKQEILLLEKRLQDQLMVHGALEKALGFRCSALDSSNDSLMPKSAKELIREIAVLELEVTHLEQYLLSLYRKAFDQQISMVSPPAVGERAEKLSSTQPGPSQEAAKHDMSYGRRIPAVQSSRIQLPRKWATNAENEAYEVKCHEKLAGPGVHRSHSSLSQRAVCSARISPSEESLARALRSCHSQPLSFLEEEQNATSGVISLAEYLGTNIADHVPETPNKLSEDMVRCMSAIYCKLADPPLVHHGLPSSPTSSFSSMSALSPQYLGEMWSPGYQRESTLDARLINPFRVEGLKEFSGPYNAMVEVPLICRDRRRLKDIEDLLQNYKSIIRQLETVDPRKMKNEEKLAFWINIHNALMMHFVLPLQVYLEYGIPQNNAKKASLLIKATCVVGGRSVSAATIQGSILGCRTNCPGQWLWTFFNPRMKYKVGDEWRAYAIEQPEPLLRFALCSGSHSDPAVRIYTSKRLFQQLEAAKEEFIRASVAIWKEQKILLPKVIDAYAKDTRLSSQGLVDMIQCYLPETLRMAMQRCLQGRANKVIEWIPYNFTFRYLLSRELAFPQIN